MQNNDAFRADAYVKLISTNQFLSIFCDRKMSFFYYGMVHIQVPRSSSAVRK